MSTENSQMPYHPSDAYCPNGSCDWLKLLTIAIPFSVLAAFVLAVVITPVFVTGICAIIVPVIAGAVLGCVAEGLFRLAHCRNPKVAAGLGILLGTTMFLGSYHAYFVWSKGVGAVTRIDSLPRFIDFHMRHDVFLGRRGIQSLSPVRNWILFTLNWLCAACACAAVTTFGAMRVYCENCKCRMVKKNATAPSGKASAVVAAITAKQIDSLPEWPAVNLEGGTPASSFQLEYCPGQSQQAECGPIFLTAMEIGKGKENAFFVRRLQLSVDEAAELEKKLSFR